MAKGRFGLLERLSKATTGIMRNPGGISLQRRLTLITKHTTELLNAEASEILLVKRRGFLTLEASHGHRKGKFKRGKEFAIRSGRKVGLTGHLAAVKEPVFSAHGEALTRHPAVRGVKADHLPSGECNSLLTIQLRKKTERGEKLIGLLRVENKKSAAGRSSPRIGFTDEDASVLNIFAEAIVVAMESAELVAQQGVQKNLLQKLVKSSPDGIIAADERGFVIQYNERAEQILGYKAREAVNRINVSELYHDPREARAVGKRLRSRRDGTVSYYETRLVSKAREVIPVRLTATRLHDPRGKWIGSVGYFEDLRSIQEKERHLELLLQASDTISRARTVEDGLERLAKMLVSLIPCTFCRILLMDEGGRNLVPKAAYPIPRTEGRLKWNPGIDEPLDIAGWPELEGWLKRGKPWLVNARDAKYKKRLAKISERMELDDVVESLLLVPFEVEGKTVGILDLGEMRGAARAAFTPEKINLASAIASQTAVLIHRIRLYGDAARHSRLLTAMDDALQHIRAEKDPNKLLQEFVRLAAELVGCKAGGLYFNDTVQKQPLLTVTYRLDDRLTGSRLARRDGLIARVLETGEAQVARDYAASDKREPALEPFGFKQVIAVPLTKAGEIEAILFVGDETGRANIPADSVAVLKRFVTRSAVALHTAELVTSEQRMFDQLHFLHKINDYIQAAEKLDDILFVAVTGVTAGYGLGFNRAALLLLDEERKWLEGKMGIGHNVEEAARRAWDDTHRQGLYDLNRLLDALKRGKIPRTPLGRLIPKLHIPLDGREPDALWRAVLRRRPKPVRVKPSELKGLPEEFLKAFRPTTEVAIIPLISKEKAVGLLVVDNKFTLSPITDEDLDALARFTSSAAVAIDQFQLVQQAKSGVEKLRSSFIASAALISEKPPPRVMQDIVNQMRADSNASWVSLVLIDETGRTRRSYTSGAHAHPDIAEIMREDGNSMRVMRTGDPVVIEDVKDERHGFNPVMTRQRGIAAALCLPVSMRGSRIGVIWMHYGKVRRFPASEVDAWQLYVNHAAIAYDNARRVDTLRRMRKADEELAAAADSEAALEQIVASAREVLQAESAILWLYDNTRGFFITNRSVSSGIPPELWGEFRNKGPHPEGTTYSVLSEKLLQVADVPAYPFIGQAARGLLERLGVKRFLGLSLASGREDLGVLYVNHGQPRKFRKEEVEAARAFANHAALALRRAKLMDDFNRAHKTAGVVAELTTLGGPEDALGKLEKMLESDDSETLEALNCDAVTLYVYDPVKRRLSPKPIMANVRYKGGAVQLPEVQKDSIVYGVLRRREMLVVRDVLRNKRFESSDFVRREKIASCVGVPLKVGDSTVGVMFVNYRSAHNLTRLERDNIKLFANQAAIAIHNAQLYEREQRRKRALWALYEAGREVTGSLDERKILSRITKQAYAISVSQGTPANFADIRMVQGDKIVLKAIHPRSAEAEARPEIRAAIDLNKGIGGKLGVIARTIRQSQRGAAFVPNVRLDDDYITFHPKTHSELVVPIVVGPKTVGAINIEHPEYNAFDEMDRHTFEALAAQASIAIENARQYANIQRSNAELNAKTWLAWMGISSSTWFHDCHKYAKRIYDRTEEVRAELVKAPSNDELRIFSNLNSLSSLSRQIMRGPLKPSGVRPVNVRKLVEKQIGQLKRSPLHDKAISYKLTCPPAKRLFVKGSARSLTQALRYLYENSIEAMSRTPVKELRVKIKADGGNVEIVITDTGEGIQRAVREQLFKQPVKKRGRARGLGVGLLQARAIIQAHGGDILYVPTRAKGTTMLVRLPLMAEPRARGVKDE